MRIGFTQSKGINRRIDGLIKEVEERNELEAKMKKDEKEKPAEEEDKPEEEEEMSLVQTQVEEEFISAQTLIGGSIAAAVLLGGIFGYTCKKQQKKQKWTVEGQGEYVVL